MQVLKTKVSACFEAAGLATGCQPEIEWLGNPYDDVSTCSPMAEAYRANALALGVEPFLPRDVEEGLPPGGSTDMGNVSYEVPSIHPIFKIVTEFGNHHPGFTEAAGTSDSHFRATNAAKLLAMTTLDLLSSPELVNAAKARSRPCMLRWTSKQTEYAQMEDRRMHMRIHACARSWALAHARLHSTLQNLRRRPRRKQAKL